jgi:ribonuclease P protein component
VLPPGNRLRRRPDFAAAVRRGRRAGRGAVVVHFLAPTAPVDGSGPGDPARVGLVVGRTVGPAVVRNRVKRRLRHLMRERVETLPPGSLLVVRAGPAAAEASSDALARDVDAALGRARGRRGASA